MTDKSCSRPEETKVKGAWHGRIAEEVRGETG